MLFLQFEEVQKTISDVEKKKKLQLFFLLLFRKSLFLSQSNMFAVKYQEIDYKGLRQKFHVRTLVYLKDSLHYFPKSDEMNKTNRISQCQLAKAVKNGLQIKEIRKMHLD